MQMRDRRNVWWRIDYLSSPDFTRPPAAVPEQNQQRMLSRLAFLYGEDTAREVLPELLRLIRIHLAHKPEELTRAEQQFVPSQRFSEKDLMLITYGDMVASRERTGLSALKEFLAAYRRGEPVFSILHVLPFFPYSSDRGFSVVDFKTVDPRLGTWEDIRDLGKTFRLMFDGVLNHASAQSLAFQEMLCGNPRYRDFAVSFRSPDELTAEQRAVLRRPRTSDVLTMYHSIDGPLWVWTTFSHDQIDLNYRNPHVLLNSIDTLLFYVRMGADFVRLDAVTYLWKELGTPSASLEQTHAIVKLFRDVLDVASPQTALITETNVPHAENVSYFGNGHDEAQCVYNFALPPLVLHAFYRGDTTWLSKWAAELEYPSDEVTYLNMLDTHDGVGLPGAQDILPPEEIDFLVDHAREHGAFISHRATPQGDVPYEINTTWYSALNFANNGETRETQVRRFAASRAIALALRGIPAVYLHSLAGSRSDVRLALETKVKRDVNRPVLDYEYLIRALAEPGSKVNLISERLRRLFRIRTLHTAFHPNGPQRVLSLSPALFSLLRTSPDGAQHVICIVNVTNRPVDVAVPVEELDLNCLSWFDLLGGRGWQTSCGNLRLEVSPYDVLWLSPFQELEKQIEDVAHAL